MKKQIYISLVMLLMAVTKIAAHPMPHSVMLLDIKQKGISATLSMPLKEFQIVFPNEDIDSGYQTLIQRKSQWLDAYLLKHISIKDAAGHTWTILINGKSVSENEQPLSGKYHELTFNLWLQPAPGSSPRNFIMNYDAIMHQLVTHKLFIKISNDWYGGLRAKDSTDADLGVLMMNPADGKIPPVVINLDEGNTWKGFKAMVALGIDHIAEGTDHLLFLIVLVLPATWVAEGKRWTKFGGSKYSIIRLLKIITAFTIGHSVSLLLGAMHWLALPQQPVEITIAFTILVTAIHAIYPLFYRKEVFIAIGFGLIHGLAFSTVLSEMNLDGKQLAWSILGFNAGIELMQLFVMLCVVPWLIVLSKTDYFKWIRIGGAACAIVASLAWMMEPITNQSNSIAAMVQQIADQGKWLIVCLALLAITSMVKKSALSAD
jgi:hypothetical protein